MERSSIRILSLIAFALVVATDLFYIALINSQGPSPQPYISRFVAGYVALMAALLVVALAPRPEIVPIRVAIRAAVASGLFLLGFLFRFPVGLAFVAAGFLVFFALRRTARETTRSRPARFSGLLAAALAVAVLLAGLEVAQRAIVCPEHGNTTGGGPGLITGPYQYECVNGVARYHGG